MGEALALRLKSYCLERLRRNRLTDTYFVWASQDKRPEVNGHHRPDYRIWTCIKHVQTVAGSTGHRSLETKRAIKRDVLTSCFFASVSDVENKCYFLCHLALPVDNDKGLLMIVLL